VLTVDQEKQRIALGLKQLTEDPWLRAVPDRYIPGMIVHGKVTKITNFGVFVELEDDLEGLLHVSELADHKVDDPHNEVKIGEDIEVKILRVDTSDRKIGLSKKRADWAAAAAEGGETAPTKSGRPKVRRGGLLGEAGDLGTDLISSNAFLKSADGADVAGDASSAEAESEETESAEAADVSEAPETPETPEAPEVPEADEADDAKS
jgi:small subunit ribosomal protein S1